MPLRDLLRLADLALSGSSGTHVTEDLLRAVVEETSSRAGVLRREGAIVARWPRTMSTQVEAATGGWTDVPFDGAGPGWQMRLLNLERLDDAVLDTVRLSLRGYELQEELKRSRFDERFHVWELEAIRSIATGIGGILEPARLAEELVNHLVALLGVRSMHVYLGPSSAEAVSVGGFGPEEISRADLEEAWSQLVYRDEVVAVPLASDAGTLGVLTAAHKEARAGGTEPFAARDVRLLELFAIQVTVALEYARLTRESLERERLRRELEVAAVIQSYLHPRELPSLREYRLAARSSSSRQVAGDTYDVLVVDDGLLVTVTDVSGKGVGAGMLAAGVHAGVRLLSGGHLALDELTARIGRYLSGATADNRFATFVIVHLRPDGALTAVNAGHLPLLIRRGDGRVDQISSGGLPLGILDSAAYERATDHLDPGDMLFLYTDGLTEAENPDEEEFGIERVEEVVSGLGGTDVDEACSAILHRVDEHACGRPLQDDATLLVVQRL